MTPRTSPPKIAVLLANHGSRSETWRNALLDLEARVRPDLLKIPGVTDVRTGFMEYSQPSIATRLKEFDGAGMTHIVIVPIFLTASSHTVDDIPTIAGQKDDPEVVKSLAHEKIERYKPNAVTHIAPTLDFTDMLSKNVARRAKSLSSKPEEEGLVMIAYGDQEHEHVWTDLISKVGEYVRKDSGIDTFSHGWCGHLVHHNPDKTTEAIEAVLATKRKAIVVPVLVARDEMFQGRVIVQGIAHVSDHEHRVAYLPDSILPDEALERWVVEIVGTFAQQIQHEASRQTV